MYNSGMNFYELTDTQPSDFSAEQQGLIEKHIDNLPDNNTKKVVAYDYINILATSDTNSTSERRHLIRKANMYLRELAAEGITEMQSLLGQYLLNRDVSAVKGMSNAEEAKHWLEKAVEQKSGRAAYLLSWLYEYTRGDMPRDLDKKEYYLELAKKLGYDARNG